MKNSKLNLFIWIIFSMVIFGCGSENGNKNPETANAESEEMPESKPKEEKKKRRWRKGGGEAKKTPLKPEESIRITCLGRFRDGRGF